MPFDFAYSVNDPATANSQSHKAVSDGDVTRGEYRVQLPDGRTQVVRYTADWKNGYNAEVSLTHLLIYSLLNRLCNVNRFFILENKFELIFISLLFLFICLIYRWHMKEKLSIHQQLHHQDYMVRLVPIKIKDIFTKFKWKKISNIISGFYLKNKTFFFI